MRKCANKVVGPDGWLYPEGTTFSDIPRDPREIATDENLALAALDNQMRAERDEQDRWTMTADKLAKKLPGMGAASLQLPDGLAQSYDEREFRIEDEELLREAQRDYQGGTMQQEITQEHRNDEDGRPAGGTTTGRGINIEWQNGPLGVGEGERLDPNGAFVEGVIAAAVGRLEYYQSSPFACRENALAITKLQEALHWLGHRTADRIARGVEGTHKP